MTSIAEQLRAAGMSAVEAEAKGALFARIEAAWRGWSSLRPARAWFVPGRVELLGKHTDYAGGRSLLCAAERGFCVLAAGSAADRVRLLDVRTNARAELRAGAETPQSWTRYPASVLRRLRADGRLAQGADIAFASDLPSSAGLSSSSAFVVASHLALCGDGWLGGREALAAYLAAAEAGVGTHGGSEDHTAILCCEAGCWSQFQFCPARCEAVMAAPEAMRLVIGVSGVTASKAGAAQADYNRAADAIREILALWNEASGRNDPTLAAALAGAGYEALQTAVPRSLRPRLEQFHNESRVWLPAAVEAARDRDWTAFGDAVRASQGAAEAVLGNQIPETTALAAQARALGAVAASSFGAGFGGSVWALVRRAEADSFRAAWKREYQKQFAAHAGDSLFFESAAGPAAVRLSLA